MYCVLCTRTVHLQYRICSVAAEVRGGEGGFATCFCPAINNSLLLYGNRVGTNTLSSKFCKLGMFALTEISKFYSILEKNKIHFGKCFCKKTQIFSLTSLHGNATSAENSHPIICSAFNQSTTINIKRGRPLFLACSRRKAHKLGANLGESAVLTASVFTTPAQPDTTK